MTENRGSNFFKRWTAKLGWGEKVPPSQEVTGNTPEQGGYDVALGWEGVQGNYTKQIQRVEQSLQAVQTQLPPEMAERVQNQIDVAYRRLAKYQEQPTTREEVNTRWQELLTVAKALNLDGIDRALLRIANGVSVAESKIEASFPQANPTPEGVPAEQAWRRELEIYDKNVRRVESSLAEAAAHLSPTQHNAVQRLINRSRTLLANSQATPDAAQYSAAVQAFKDAGKQVPLYNLDLELRMIADQDKTEDERQDSLASLDELLKAHAEPGPLSPNTN